jgi:hypothetical protein
MKWMSGGTEWQCGRARPATENFSGHPQLMSSARTARRAVAQQNGPSSAARAHTPPYEPDFLQEAPAAARTPRPGAAPSRAKASAATVARTASEVPSCSTTWFRPDE